MTPSAVPAAYCPNETLVAPTAQLNAGGYRSQDAALKSLAKAGVLMADFIGLDLSASKLDGFERAVGIVAYRKASEADAPQHLVQHKELREAVWLTL